jgi:hypothetical protein
MPNSKPNFNRMLQLIDEVFATRNDPGQIQVDQKQQKKLHEIHPATLTEYADDNGPLIWVLMIPTTYAIMTDFLSKKISEKELLARTQPGATYDCIYLCSATTLPECRSKGETKKLCVAAIRAICKDHPVTTLFVWPFTKEGQWLAEAVAKACNLTLKLS